MKIFTKTFSKENFRLSWFRLLIQGILLTIIGASVAMSSIMNSDATVMAAKEFSWLPLSGIILFILGLEECLEAYIADNSREFHQNLQVGILDAVIGALIFFSISGDPERLSLMISSFLLVRGIVRIALVRALSLPQPIFTSIFGVISISLGLGLFLNWPTSDAWFLSFCINAEIAFRGWAMMMFALWIRKIKLQSAS